MDNNNNVCKEVLRTARVFDSQIQMVEILSMKIMDRLPQYNWFIAEMPLCSSLKTIETDAQLTDTGRL